MAQNKYKEITLEVLKEKYVNTLDSGHKVARELGVSYSTFNRALKAFGLKARGRVSSNEKLRDKEWLKEQYYTNQRSCRDIAIEIGSTRGAVHSALRFLGLKLRKANTALRLKYPEGRFGKDASNWRGGRRRVGTKGSYIAVYSPEHPNVNKDGYVMEHRLVMEQKLGRLLKQSEYVHHMNGDKKDNRPENLQLMSSHADHTALHMNAIKENAELKERVIHLESLLKANGIVY